jgi:hypothetical protein
MSREIRCSFFISTTPAPHIAAYPPTPDPASGSLWGFLLLILSFLGVNLLATVIRLLRTVLTVVFDVLRLSLVILSLACVIAGDCGRVLEVQGDVWFTEMKGALLEEA